MEEVRLNDIHIRQTHNKNYKIYNISTLEELFFNTYSNFKTEDMKNDKDVYNLFVKAFINDMKNSDRIDDDFVKEIIKQMIIYLFKRQKTTIIRYID